MNGTYSATLLSARRRYDAGSLSSEIEAHSRPPKTHLRRWSRFDARGGCTRRTLSVPAALDILFVALRSGAVEP